MPNDQLSSINHIVVLMLENRSFDHMLGFLYADTGNVSPAGQPFEGLTGQESNPGSDGAPVSVFKIQASDPSPYFMPGADPGEGYDSTNSQLFGTTQAPTPPVATNNGFVNDFAYTLGWEQKEGWSILPGTAANDIMGIFTPDLLPVLSGLARGYAVCDQWFGSVPTETLPNRAFALAATSQGHMDDKTKSWTCPTIFSLLTANNLGWSDLRLRYAAAYPTMISRISLTPMKVTSVFSPTSRRPRRPGLCRAFTFLEPSWGASGNSQHPNYNVALGEQLIHDVYYALRNGPSWNDTLLIVTYDEHGGCYDHVPPPTNAVPPDNTAGEYGFDFKRFGPRVPTVLVSPLIAAGTVFRVAADAMPLDHTSILKTIETRWSLPTLTARDAAAGDVGAVLTLTTPRTDDPLLGVVVPMATGPQPDEELPSHLQQVQAELVSRLPVPDAQGGTHHVMPPLKTSSDYKAYIIARTNAWKAAKELQAPTARGA